MQHILALFDPISLKEMDGVKLMNRTDTKFTFHVSKLPALLDAIRGSYFCLAVGGITTSRYSTVYYDTDELSLYQQHHNGVLNRYKIRHRTYVDSGQTFLEVKFKSNKERTIKTRIKSPLETNGFGRVALQFLEEELPFDPKNLRPSVWVNYTRVTLVSKTSAERLTIDVNLELRNGERMVHLGNLVIAEVKQESRKASVFIQEVKRCGIREGAISKYCFAIALTRDAVKRNNFKQKIKTIKEIIHDTPVTNQR
ncbi:MAG: polyphosphate polymerase domain-containing protein [Sediminibacterium sp.]|nr:polyphosphate polymerase domain-containing protein [Sediminibacterium sp.]